MRLTPHMDKYVREAYDKGALTARGMLWKFSADPKYYDLLAALSISICSVSRS